MERGLEIIVSDPTKLKFAVDGSHPDFFVKHGAYAEIEQPLSKTVDVIGRVDGMYRIGNVAAGSDLSDKASVVRYTLGTSYAIERALRLKVSTELWQFGDKDASGHSAEVGVHSAVVGAF